MRTAMVLSRHGTVRSAAAELNVHRATVTRHIDALEDALATKLFLRHKDGYTLTSDGKALHQLAESTDRLMERFVQDTTERNETLTGALTITCLVGTAPELLKCTKFFCEDHPAVNVRILAENKRLRLELGEADIAVRTGPRPRHPDYVVLPYRSKEVGLFGHRSYFARHAQPGSTAEFAQHWFVGVESNDGFIDVVKRFRIPRQALSLVTNDPMIAIDAIRSGFGLGQAGIRESEADCDLIRVLPRLTVSQQNAWLVTHVDLHRSRLVQAFLEHLRGADVRKGAP